MAAGTDKEKDEQANENELLRDYDNVEAEIIISDTIKAVKKKKRKREV